MRFTKEHEWIKLEENIGTVGITDFAQSSLGDIIFVDISTLNEKLNADDVFGSVDAVKTASDLFLPVDGEVIEINPLIEENPELLNSDPYGEGWLIKIRVDNVDDINNLMNEEEYSTYTS